MGTVSNKDLLELYNIIVERNALGKRRDSIRFKRCRLNNIHTAICEGRLTIRPFCDELVPKKYYKMPRSVLRRRILELNLQYAGVALEVSYLTERTHDRVMEITKSNGIRLNYRDNRILGIRIGDTRIGLATILVDRQRLIEDKVFEEEILGG